jgi:hypothetical protein
METTDTQPALRLVRPGEPAGASEPSSPDVGATLSTEDYWARVQQLRADLAALRPAN